MTLPDGARPFLAVRGIRKSFGPVEVLHGVDLDLLPGSVTALLGENGAGKSTFVRILAGDYQPDAGKVELDGVPVHLRTVARARELGIRLIAQEIADAPTLSVAENVLLGAWPLRAGFVDRPAMHRTARATLETLGANLPLGAPVSSLRLGERQIVEIARAMVGSSRCLILDEPTAALSDAETQRLFALVRRMREQGAAILYITHRLDEVATIADRVVVLRDGRVALDALVADASQPSIVEAMVGRSLAIRHDSIHAAPPPGRDLLQAQGLSSPDFEDVSLAVGAGEIVGLYGKVGSGVPELAAALFGATALKGGRIAVEGRPVTIKSPAEAIRHGIGYLSGDRAGEGLLGARPVAENLAAPSWGRLARRGWIGAAAERRAYLPWYGRLRVRSRPDGAERITTLSGGNQQKVMLGRWLEARSRILVLTEPTRGVDVGARAEIYQVLRDLARQGHGIVVATSDYEDVTAMATRAIVMVRGRIVATLAQDEISTASLTQAAGAGALDHAVPVAKGGVHVPSH